MNPNELNNHKDAFLFESQAHVAAMNAALLKLEKSPEDNNGLHEILRAAHTLKSMAATMNYGNMAKLCHSAEDVVTAILHGQTKLSGCVDILFECFDRLEFLLGILSRGEPETNTDDLIVRLRALNIPTVEVTQHLLSHDNTDPVIPLIEPIRKVAVSVDKLDTLLKLAEELLVERMRLDRMRERLNHPELSATVESVGRLIADLQYHVMQSRMVPIGFVFSRFPRMVRDLARAQGKDISLVLEGEHIELDRAIIDEIGDCLVHLLRNAVDHGIESSQKRSELGKPIRGEIKLVASRDKQSALISIEDDGAGIDLDAVKRIAMKYGVLEANSMPEQIIKTIFSGISTTTEVTAVSGRGVGLNIVKRKIEAIGGSINVTSTPGESTRFTMLIPLTMAVIKTLFVGVGGRTYAIPVTNIERLVSAEANDVKRALGEEAIILNNEKVPIRRLSRLFHCKPGAMPQQPIVIVYKGRARMGLAVDALKSTEEVVIKPLNGSLRNNQYFAGSALIGSGEVVMVLEVGHLLEGGFAKSRSKELPKCCEAMRSLRSSHVQPMENNE